jgi:molecular chaperone GrpE
MFGNSLSDKKVQGSCMKEHHSKHSANPKPHEQKAEAGDLDQAPAAPVETPSEIEQLKDRILRLQADYDNFRKRTIRDRDELALRANADLLLRILPVMDHFERGLRDARAHKVDKGVIDGFHLIYDQLLGALLKAGLVPINAEGQMFDPNFHEAVTHVPSDEHPADIVVTETRRGYLLGDKLLRASQVIVSSGPAVPPPQAPDETQAGEPSGEKAP